MALTGAERQAAWRERGASRVAVLEADLARVTAERDSLRREVDGLADECERLRGMACKHPAAAVDGGVCRACGADVY